MLLLTGDNIIASFNYRLLKVFLGVRPRNILHGMLMESPQEADAFGRRNLNSMQHDRFSSLNAISLDGHGLTGAVQRPKGHRGDFDYVRALGSVRISRLPMGAGIRVPKMKENTAYCLESQALFTADACTFLHGTVC